jgi:hypothetical protein
VVLTSARFLRLVELPPFEMLLQYVQYQLSSSRGHTDGDFPAIMGRFLLSEMFSKQQENNPCQ